jgi:tetratricopeptide (TPR) repeat protein
MKSLGDHEQAVAAAEAAVVRAGDSVEPKDGPVFQRTLVNLAEELLAKADGLIADARYDEGITVLDNVIARFEDDLAPELRRAVASALGKKMAALEQAGRVDEAFEARGYMMNLFAGEGVAVPDVGGA